MSEPQAEVVAPGERENLQRVAQATGERLGRQDTRIEGHDDHFVRLNGSLARIDATLHDMAVAQAVQTASIASIQRTNLERDERGARRQGWSTQVWLGIAAAVIALFGIGVTLLIAIAALVTQIVLAS